MVANENDWQAAHAEIVNAVSTEARRLLGGGNRRGAIAVLDSASEELSPNPAHVRAHLAFVAGAFLQGFGQNDAATERFERAVQAEQGNAQYWLGLAGAHLSAGRISEALVAAEQSLSLTRAEDFWWWLEPQALGVRGRCLLAAGDQSGAMALLDQFSARISSGVPPNPWCELQLVGDLLEHGIELNRCRVYLNAVLAQATATNDADLERRVRPLVEQAQT